MNPVKYRQLTIPRFMASMNIEFDVGAIQQGWATWPFNFDPIWLKQCTGYREVG